MDLFSLGFSVAHGIGPAKFQLLLGKFGTTERAWSANEEELKEILGEKLAGEFSAFKKTFSLENYLGKLNKKNVEFVSLSDEQYPKLLKQTKNPPIVIYYKGDKKLFNRPKTIAIVGTRKISEYGKEVTKMLAQELVVEGFVIVSGLAFGVDSVAHKVCLDQKGKTIAVLGSGVDICTPHEHQKLYEEIVLSRGLVVSTLPLGEPSTVHTFPARNKIIAGLSLGTIVTEGTTDSGALYTADFAKKMGRPVFSVPGPITSSLSGATTKLLKEGAHVITSAQDIVDKLGIMNTHYPKTAKAVTSDDPIEQEILDLLEIAPLHFNEIARRIGKDSKTLGSFLSLMELKGIIHSLFDGRYSL